MVVLLVGAAAGLTAESPTIVTRADWSAKPPVLVMKANKPIRLTIHHTGNKRNFEATVAAKLRALQVFSQKDSRLADGRLKKAWGDVPYHYFIDANGTIAEGREVKYIADTNTDYDPNGHLTVVVEGNFEIEQPNGAQITSLENLLVYLSEKYGIDPATIAGHRDFAKTACPGRNLIAILPDVREDVERRVAEDSGNTKLQ